MSFQREGAEWRIIWAVNTRAMYRIQKAQHRGATSLGLKRANAHVSPCCAVDLLRLSAIWNTNTPSQFWRAYLCVLLCGVRDAVLTYKQYANNRTREVLNSVSRSAASSKHFSKWYCAMVSKSYIRIRSIQNHALTYVCIRTGTCFRAPQQIHPPLN